MRGPLSIALAAAAIALAAGCGSQGTVSPTAETVQGTIAAPAKGNPSLGKAVFLRVASPPCGSCHSFKPAGTNGTVGPDLDKLPQYAKTANQGSLEEFTHTSIVDPGAYTEKGFPAGVMPSYGDTLSSTQVSDLVAFLTQGAK